MMSSAEHWWIHLTVSQRDFIQTYLLFHDPDIKLIDVIPTAFKKQQNIGWYHERGFPESTMRII